MRKYQMGTGKIYHVMNKSIAGYEIFCGAHNCRYATQAMRYFALANPPSKISHFLNKDPVVKKKGFEVAVRELGARESWQVQILAYCLMPTHFHILLRQNEDDGGMQFMRKFQNAFARYFNVKHERKGPLWEGPFKNVPIDNDEQLLHVTRYIHLNPVSAGLCKKPEDWSYSSYGEFLNREAFEYPLTEQAEEIDLGEKEYRKFCEDQAGYQRDLAMIKKEVLE